MSHERTIGRHDQNGSLHRLLARSAARPRLHLAVLQSLLCASVGPALAQGPPAPLLSERATGSASPILQPTISANAVFPSGISSDRIRGLVVARQQATISASQPSTIQTIGPDNGERFAKGDVLVRFDCGINDAELKRARAIGEAARDTLRVKQELAANGSVARLQALLAESELKKALAEVVVAEARVSYCVISAPFSGRVVRRVANAHETVAPRDPLIEIVDDSAVEVRAFVPSNRIGRLAAGGAVRLIVDETGVAVHARIVSIGAAIDNVSQQIEIRAAPIGKPELLAGMSGRIELEPADLKNGVNP